VILDSGTDADPCNGGLSIESTKGPCVSEIRDNSCKMKTDGTANGKCK